MENNQDTRPMTVGDWMVTLLILALPLINIIMVIFWALSSSGNLNRRNYCRASLIWFAIMLVLSLGVFVVMAALGWAMGGMQQL